MKDTLECSRCGCELPAKTPDELCPACLLQAGLEDGSSDSGLVAARNSDPRLAPTTPQGGRFVPPAAEELAPLFPQLEVLTLLGHGGMGAVYQARQKKLDRLVALKIIRPESAVDPAFAERFMREARTLARLSHAGIVAVHDFGEVETGTPSEGRLYYFVMEYVDGASLRQLMETGELTTAQTLAVIPQICEALQFAHDEGVVHRDIKPENILVDSKGRVKIADFGLAKLGARSPEDFTLTATHQVMGTPRYMAPEQMAGARAVDHRADIYSLGVVLYEMLTGEVPMGQFAPPSQKVPIDSRLDDIVLRALASEPERRFQRASEMKSSVDQISSGAWAPDVTQAAERPYHAGPSTIMERELIGAWRWVAGGSASPRQTEQSYPTLLALTLTIVGCLMLLLPWCNVNVAGPEASHQFAAENASEAVATVLDQRATFVSASLLPAAPFRQATTRQLPAHVQTVSFPLLAQEAWPGSESPLRATTGMTHTFQGLDLNSGIVAGIVFSLMTLLLLVFPEQLRRLVLWNTCLLLLAVTAVISTLSFSVEVAHTRIRIPIDPQRLSLNSEPVREQFIEPEARLCFWQTDDSRAGSSGSVMFPLHVREVDHTIEYRVGFFGSLGLALTMLVLSATGIRNATLRFCDSTSADGPAVGSPLASFRFSAQATEDLQHQMEFHFGQLGYQLQSSRPGEFIFKRGSRLGGLYETDIRKLHTTLTIRTIVSAGKRLQVNCAWVVRTLGAWVPQSDIRSLEQEGRDFAVLLESVDSFGDVAANEHRDRANRYAVDGGVVQSASAIPDNESERPVRLPGAPDEFDDSRITETGQRRIVLMLSGPAGGLKIVAALHMIFWLLMGPVWILEEYGNYFRNGSSMPERVLSDFVLIGAGCLALFLVAGVIVSGSRCMLRRRGYPWCVTAAVLACLPVSGAWLVGLPVGIWALRVLRRPVVRTAFEYRELQLSTLADRQRADLTEVRSDLGGPALALTIAGFLTAVGHAITLAVCLTQTYHHDATAGLIVPGIVIGILMFIGGLNLRYLWSRSWAQVGAIAGMVPISAGAILTILSGVWVMNTMRKPHIREAFLETERQRQLYD
ncbi:protein kinase [bacterium]|nr:protein kinase [bacterium]